MTWPFIIIFVGLLLTAWLGIPIGVGLAMIGLAILHFVAGGATQLAVNAVWNLFTDFTLSAVPLFIFMGEILMVSGVSRRIYSGISPFFERIPGRLLHTNIAVCTVFGSVSGASTSTAAAIGSVAYPELRDRKYHLPTVVGTLAAGGTLGLLIPPSLSLLIYGATQGVSIGRLFLAGILPGLMFTILFMSAIVVIVKQRPQIVPDAIRCTPWVDRISGLARLWPVVVLAFSVLGTIYLGWATPTEAAGIGVVASIVIGFMSGDLTIKKLWGAFHSATFTFGAIMFVAAGAIILAQSISITGLPHQLMQGISELSLSKYVILSLVVVIYLCLGCFFDGISLMLMTLPLVFPVLTGLGFDPIWLGVIITVLIEIGMLTPPVGINLFVLVGITKGEVSIGEAARATIPFWLILLSGVLILTLAPEIALFLPELVYSQ